MLYDSYEDLEEWWYAHDAEIEDEVYEEYWEMDNDPVIAVTFNSSCKRYFYFTDEFDLHKGDKLEIKSWQGNRATVTVEGYSAIVKDAKKYLKIIKTINPNRKFKKQEKKNMRKSNKTIENTKDALTEAKEVAMKIQKGSAVIVAIKAAVYESSLVPTKVKLLVDSGNGISDLVIGLLLQVAAETFTESEIIRDAAKAANFAGAASASSEFTMIQDLIEKIVINAVEKVDKKLVKKESEKESKG